VIDIVSLVIHDTWSGPSGGITSSLTVDEVLSALVSQANGMFLWASVMTTYLASPFLTPWE